MLHPDLDDLIRHIRSRGMMAGLITNGYFLVPKRIEAAERRRPRLPADQHRQRRAGRGVEEEPAAARQEAAAPEGPRDLRRQHQLGARRRHQEPGRRAHDQQPRARSSASRPRSASSTTARGRLKPLGAGRAQGVRRGVGRDQRPVAGAQEPLLGDSQLPGQPGGRQAERVALPRRRALPVRLRGRARPLLLAAARLPRRAARVATRSTTSGASSRTPKSCAPYCTVGCVHRVSTMDFWRSPQDARRRSKAVSRLNR